MSSAEPNSEVFAALAEEFVDRYRRGERPLIQEYADRYPHLAEEIRDFFSAVVMVEQLAPQASDSFGNPNPESMVSEASSLAIKQLGDYRIIREVGRGGMGIVYEAEQVSLSRHVALKVLPSNALPDDKHIRRFEREAKAAGRLHHTNIVPVFGVGEQDGTHYYVMQFIRGLPLDQVIVELKRIHNQPADPIAAGPQVGRSSSLGDDCSVASVAQSLMTCHFPALAPSKTNSSASTARTELMPTTADSNPSRSASFIASDTVDLAGSATESAINLGKSGYHLQHKKRVTYWESVANIGEQVAGALQYAHDQGILHRDIKPSNLLLDLRGTTWVTDFGLAKASDQQDLTHTGDILGTLRYMPPEAFHGGIDVRGDVYSLGLTLYELLVFQPAFGIRDRNRLINQLMTEDPPRLDKLNPAIPRDLVTIVHKAIDRDPSHRYQTADEMRADLQCFLNDEPIHARRVSQVERLVRWSRHNKVLATSLSTVATLVAFLAVGSTIAAGYFQLQEGEQRRLAAQNKALADQQRRLVQEKEDERIIAVDARTKAELLSQELRLRLYQNEMLLAGSSSEEATGLSQISRLTETWIPKADQPDLRGWEWYYLRGLGQRNLLTLPHQGRSGEAVRFNKEGTHLATVGTSSGEMRSLLVRFNKEGTHLATAGTDGVVKIWEMPSGQLAQTLGTPQKERWSIDVCWNPGGNLVATGDNDHLVRVWDVASGRVLKELLGCERSVRSLDWSPDGRWIVATQGLPENTPDNEPNFLCLWDVESGGLVTKIPVLKWGTCVRWSPDGQRIAATGFRTEVLDARVSSEEDGTLGTPPFPFLEQALWSDESVKASSLAWSPDSQRLAVAHSHSGKGGQVYDAKSGVMLFAVYGHTYNPLTSVSWSPKGNRFATTGADKIIQIWNTESGALEATLRGHTQVLQATAWSPDGKLLASLGQDSTKVWEFDAPVAYSTALHQEPSDDARFNPDGTLCSVQTGHFLFLYRTDDWTPFLKLPSPLRHEWDYPTHAWSPDGSQIAISASRRITIFDVNSGQQRIQYELPEVTAGTANSISWTPDGKLLAVGGQNLGRLFILEAETGDLVHVLPSDRRIKEVAWSPDSHRLAIGSDRLVQIYDMRSRDFTVNRDDMGWSVESICWNPDGTQVACSAHTEEVWIIDAITGHDIHRMQGHSDFVRAIRWSPDGSRIATASVDKTIRIWDPLSGRPTLIIRSNKDPIRRLAWSPNSRVLVSTAHDGIKIFDARFGSIEGKGNNQSNRQQEIIDETSRAIEAGNATTLNLDFRANAYFKLEQYDLAMRDWLLAGEKHDDVNVTGYVNFRNKRRWKEAITLGNAFIDKQPDSADSTFLMQLAAMSLYAGDRTTYRKVCDLMKEKFKESEQHDEQERTLKTCLLAVDNLEVEGLPEARFVAALEEGSTSEGFASWGWMTRALYVYRSGDANLAIEYVNQSRMREPEDLAEISNLCILAMAYQQLEQVDQAKANIEAARLLLDKLQGTSDPSRIHDVLIGAILFNEAQAKLSGGSPAKSD